MDSTYKGNNPHCGGLFGLHDSVGKIYVVVLYSVAGLKKYHG